MAQQINLVTLGVDDLDESILFYEDVLGFTSMAQEGNVAIFNLSSSWLALLPKGALNEESNWIYAKGDGVIPSLHTLTHHVASKSDVDKVIWQAVEAGAKLLKKPADQPSGGYSGYFTDPSGHLWQIVWNPYFCTYSDNNKHRTSLPH
ncbi:MAG: VOC family protein [Magnetococcales bacterium]|nr:VOC family protein [Magnetococcales bacterium]